jgi:hypothetical protein
MSLVTEEGMNTAGGAQLLELPFFHLFVILPLEFPGVIPERGLTVGKTRRDVRVVRDRGFGVLGRGVR